MHQCLPRYVGEHRHSRLVYEQRMVSFLIINSHASEYVTQTAVYFFHCKISIHLILEANCLLQIMKEKKKKTPDLISKTWLKQIAFLCQYIVREFPWTAAF